MDLKDEAVVHVDFTIEQRDLFQASLNMAKRRLLIGILIVTLLSLGLVYFFIMIDEQVILLQTSALFIGLPLLAVGGQILRLHAVCRKYVAGLSESQRRVQYMFSDIGDGYDLVWGGSFSHITWNDLMKVVEKPTFFLIYLNGFEVHMIPKGGFHQKSDLSRLRRILHSKLGTKAEIQDEELQIS